MWEDVNIFVYSDTSFTSPRSDGGRLIVLTGRNGSTYSVKWRSKRQAAMAASSGDAEAIEWTWAVKVGSDTLRSLNVPLTSHSSWQSNAGAARNLCIGG